MIPWRRKWQPIPDILAWKIPGTEEPGRLQSIKESDMTEYTAPRMQDGGGASGLVASGRGRASLLQMGRETWSQRQGAFPEDIHLRQIAAPGWVLEM